MGAGKLLPDDAGTGEVEYRSCPLHFVPGSVWEWFEEYEHVTRYPHTAPAFRDTDARKRGMERYYLARRAEYADAMRRGAGYG